MQRCRRCHRIDGNRTVDGDIAYWTSHIGKRENNPRMSQRQGNWLMTTLLSTKGGYKNSSFIKRESYSYRGSYYTLRPHVFDKSPF